MKNLFTYLLMTAFGLSTVFAQNNSKTPAEGYSLEERLGIQEESSKESLTNQAKLVEGTMSALSGYVAGETIEVPLIIDFTNVDEEYVDSLSITFPAGVTVEGVSNDDVFVETGDPALDEAFNGIDGQTISWGDNDNFFGGIFTSGPGPDGDLVGQSYNFTVTITVDGGTTGDLTADFFASGDEFGPDPGDLSGTFTIPEGQTVAGIVTNSPDHNTLEAAVGAVGLTAALGTSDPLTLFAPTDAAFDALPEGLLEDLLAAPGFLTDILLYHAAGVDGVSGNLSDGQMVTTLQGSDVTITIVGSDVFVNDVLVSTADVIATNGVVHVIDAVLLPPTSATLPLDFELPSVAYDFLAFGGAAASIIDNPDQTGNESAQVMETIRGTVDTPSEVFAGQFVNLSEAIDFSSTTTIQMDSWSPDAGITVRMAVENQEAGLGSQVAVDAQTTVSNSWETLSFDFSAIDPGVDYDRVVVIFNQEVAGNGETYYFDNIALEQLPTIFDIVEGSDVHTTLETALTESGLNAVLSNPEADLTLFAPTDDAFNALPDGVLDALLDDPNGELANVLLHHVVGGTVLSGDLMDGMEVITAQGEVVTVTITGEDVFINSGDVTAQVTAPDLEASNGVVHVIDAVLVPEFCTLFDGGPYTNFNTLFDGAPAPADGICPYNAITTFQAWASEAYVIDNFVEGRTYTFGLSGGDVGAWDPYFLVIDDATGEVVASETEGFSITWTSPADGTYLVMIGEEGFCAAGSPNLGTSNGFPYITCESDVTVVDIIVASDDHNTLEAAVLAAELEGVLAGEGPFTVFAPTDAAFDALPAGLLDELLADPDGLLTEVLQHHVHGGLAFSTDLSDGLAVPMLNGEDVIIGIEDETVTVTSALGAEAEVTVADIVASNGVVHVIDVVLTPTILNVDDLSSVSEFRMFPNPANNQVAVELQMTESDDLTIDVVNILGQNVKSFDFGTRSAGFNREILDVNDLSEGMYILNITVGDDQATTKLQINR